MTGAELNVVSQANDKSDSFSQKTDTPNTVLFSLNKFIWKRLQFIVCLFRSDMSGPPPKLPPLHNENSSVSMLDQIATIGRVSIIKEFNRLLYFLDWNKLIYNFWTFTANDPSLTNSAYDDSLSMGGSANQLPPVKKKRRRKKKRPENEPSNAESMVSGMSTTDGSPRKGLILS